MTELITTFILAAVLVAILVALAIDKIIVVRQQNKKQAELDRWTPRR